MAFPTSFVVAPLVGGIIGYFTNWMAIKMLFRPHKAWHIFGIHVPFTPGLIPKERGRVAEAIGQVISENLMSPEVLEQYLLSDDMVGKLRTAVDGFLETQKNNAEMLGAFLGHYLSEEEIQGIAEGIKGNLGKQIEDKLSDVAIGEKVAHIAMEHVINNLSESESEELVGHIIGVPHVIARRLLATILSALQNPAERILSRNINSILQNNGSEIVSNLIGSEMDSFLNTPVKKLLAGKDEQLRKVTNKIETIYRTVITEHLPRILETVDISKIVCDRINGMDIVEAEKLILHVMNKELKAIVWLGAALGFMLGWVNVLV